MKKILITTTLALALLSLGACSKKSDTSHKSSSSSTSSFSFPSSTSSSSKVETPTGNVDSSFQKAVDATQPTVATMKETYKDTYSDITATAEAPQTIVYTYTYRNQIAPTATKEAVAKQLATATASQFNQFSAVFPNFKERYIYLNSDKSELYNILVTKDDVAAAQASSASSSK
jgi:hypothetical protein